MKKEIHPGVLIGVVLVLIVGVVLIFTRMTADPPPQEASPFGEKPNMKDPQVKAAVEAAQKEMQQRVGR